MHKDQSLKKIAGMTPDERFQLARKKTNQLVGAAIRHLQTHANNAVIVYTDTLSKQVPESYAANAFNTFQIDLLHYEYIQLCKFWDAVDLDSYSVPTVIALVDDPGIGRLVYEDHFKHYESFDHTYAERWGKQARARLRSGIRKGRKIETSEILKRTRNFRDKLAHLLDITREEKRGPVSAPKYGDERTILRQTQSVINYLHLSINGTDFAWGDSRRINKRNSQSLWRNVTVTLCEREG